VAAKGKIVAGENYYPGEPLPEDEIRITLLGTGTPFPRRGQACASMLVEAGDDKFLLDCGSGAPQNFTSLEIPFTAVEKVFLTHHHVDHIGGLDHFWIGGWTYGRRTPLQIWGPPGTHHEGPLSLTTPDLSKKNMLPSGQLVDFDTESITPVSMPLQPGQASIHHACTIHGSLPNISCHRRMGMTFCFHAPNLKQRGNKRTSVMLVRGEDRYGYYDEEIPPAADDDPDAGLRHEQAVALYRAKEAELGKKTVTRLD
tara:strand:- start:5850 stop:6617 length:768 start_codon:yes stop_codon:yes gene_type:complete